VFSGKYQSIHTLVPRDYSPIGAVNNQGQSGSQREQGINIQYTVYEVLCKVYLLTVQVSMPIGPWVRLDGFRTFVDALERDNTIDLD
jgi:hypothetical protein